MPLSNLDGTFLFLDTWLSLTSRSTLESWILSQKTWKFSSDRSDTKTLKMLLASDCASTADVTGFWIVFERLSVWDNKSFPNWHPNKKTNLPIKFWTSQIRAFISVSLTTESDHLQSSINSLYLSKIGWGVWPCIEHRVGQNGWTLESSSPLSIWICFKWVFLWGDFITSYQISLAVSKVFFWHFTTLQRSLTARFSTCL